MLFGNWQYSLENRYSLGADSLPGMFTSNNSDASVVPINTDIFGVPSYEDPVIVSPPHREPPPQEKPSCPNNDVRGIPSYEDYEGDDCVDHHEDLEPPSSPDLFVQQRWATQQGGFWDTQQWLAGDFNGDGRDDMVKAFNEEGYANLDVHLSTGSTFEIERWATKQGGFWDTQQWLAGDFNGDGRDDMVKAFNEEGYASLDVHLSTGSTFEIERWATKQGGFWDTQQWLAGDFNGDGRDDMVNAFNEEGYASLDVHLSNGSTFEMQRWATKQGGFWDAQKWLVGDFNGDGLDDMVNAFNEEGYASLDVHLSTGSTFEIERWATQQGGFWDTQQWWVGDFNGDGLDDLAKAFNDNGDASLDVHLSNGSTFEMQRWSTRQGRFGNTQKWLAGDFSGDGQYDLVKASNDNGLASIDVHVAI